MKLRIQLDEEIDLATLEGWEGASVTDILKQELFDSIRAMIQEKIRKEWKKDLDRWITEEFGKDGAFKEKDGVIYVPLMGLKNV